MLFLDKISQTILFSLEKRISIDKRDYLLSGRCIEEHKMKLAIFGAKSEAKYLVEQIQKNIELDIKYFVDNNIDLQNRLINNIKVISCSELKKLYGREIDAVIVAVRGTHSRLCIIQQLREAGIEKVGIFKFSAHDFGKDIMIDCDGNSEYVIWLDQIDKPILPYLEINVVDGCNLKCKGCTHFSNLFENIGAVDYQQFVKDLQQVASKSYVIQLRLLGGEPLLHNDLYRIVEAARKILPDADIEVVTNGLLIPKQDIRLYDSMHKNKVGFLISKYKPTLQIKPQIETVLKKNKVDYFFEREAIREFGKTLSMEGNSNIEYSQRACISRGCRFLREGYLYKCPFEGLIDKFAVTFDYKDVLKIERGFDIYDERIDWEQKLEQYLKNPVPMCRYCSEKCEMFQWKIKSKPEKEDWLVE